MTFCRRSKRLASLAIIVSLALCSLCGCDREDAGVTRFTLETEKKAEVSFSWWGNDVRHNYTMEAITVFREQNPDLKVVPVYGVWSGYEKRYNLKMMSDSETDVMQINYAWLSKYSPDGEGSFSCSEPDRRSLEIQRKVRASQGRMPDNVRWRRL